MTDEELIAYSNWLDNCYAESDNQASAQVEDGEESEADYIEELNRGYAKDRA